MRSLVSRPIRLQHTNLGPMGSPTFDMTRLSLQTTEGQWRGMWSWDRLPQGDLGIRRANQGTWRSGISWHARMSMTLSLILGPGAARRALKRCCTAGGSLDSRPAGSLRWGRESACQRHGAIGEGQHDDDCGSQAAVLAGSWGTTGVV